jgi:YVTN family beta-propeller protein
VIDLATMHLDFARWKGGHFYGGYVDDQRRRLYLVGSLLDGRLLVMDTGTYAIIGHRWIGWSNYGAALDERTGDLWITRGEANEVLVLNPRLQPTAKIKVGFWPRDIKIDRARGRVYVGNYLSGTITVVDLETKKILTTVQPLRGPADQWWRRAFLVRLSGLFVDHKGDLYVADGKGIYRIDAAEIDRVVKR